MAKTGFVQREIAPVRPFVPDASQAQVLALRADQYAVVLGAPGTGKTSLLTELVATRVAAGTNPDNIVVLSPNRVAASRLRNSLGLRLGTATNGALARTPGSLAFALAQEHALATGQAAPRMLTGSEQDSIIAELLLGHIEDGFFGQELNHTTYNLARMNMFLHDVPYDKFNIELGDTLIAPHFGDDKPFDAIVSNPPYSVKWLGNEDPTLINDDRFAPAGVLAPKSKADFAFVLHALSYLSPKGRAAIVCFPGIFYRGGAEQKIRQYLVDNNYVESVISLAPNLFFGTTISVSILVLSKHKTDTRTQFIDASGLFKKETNNNALLDTHIDEIMAVFDNKANVAHFAQSAPFEQVVANGYNLSVSS